MQDINIVKLEKYKFQMANQMFYIHTHCILFSEAIGGMCMEKANEIRSIRDDHSRETTKKKRKTSTILGGKNWRNQTMNTKPSTKVKHMNLTKTNKDFQIIKHLVPIIKVCMK